MPSLTQWTWVWVNSESWWWTGRPGVLQSMGLQRVGHDWVTELKWEIKLTKEKKKGPELLLQTQYPLANVTTQVYDKPPDIQGPLSCAHPTSPSEDWMPHVRVRSESHLNQANLGLLVPGVRRPVHQQWNWRPATAPLFTHGPQVTWFFSLNLVWTTLSEFSSVLLNRIIHIFPAIFHLLLF